MAKLIKTSYEDRQSNPKSRRRRKTPFTKKGERMMRAIERGKGYGKRTPAVAAATVHAAVKRGVSGLVKKKRNPSVRRNSASEFQEGVAKALLAEAYMRQVEDLRDEGREDLYEELAPGAGGDWMDYLPPVPEAAYEDARAFERALVEVNRVRGIDDLVRRAASADGVEPDDIDEEEFGHYTMMPAMGHGVSWFDDHADFALRVPHWEPSVYVQNAVSDYIERQERQENPLLTKEQLAVLANIPYEIRSYTLISDELYRLGLIDFESGAPTKTGHDVLDEAVRSGRLRKDVRGIYHLR